jgi:DNA-binding LytR/AlgR family response regulator
LISALIGGSLTWLIGSGKNNYLLYAGSFLIASFLPTVLFLLYFIYKDAEEKIAGIGKVSMKTSDDKDQVIEKVFHLENDNGKLLLEVPVNKIICYEANDNYVITYYLDKNDQLKKSMERISLKKIEEMLAKEQVTFFRVHKSYLINPDYLEEIKGKAQAYKLQLRHFEAMIPVSRSYDVTQLEKRSF